MQQSGELSVGDVAPDFCLRVAQLVGGKPRKREICLHDYMGKQPVILTFYGAAFTPV